MAPKDRPPRKALLATSKYDFVGDLDARLDAARRLLDAMAAEAALVYPGRRLDLAILPEGAIQTGCPQPGAVAEGRAVPLEGKVLDILGAHARGLDAYLAFGLWLDEGEGSGPDGKGGGGVASNAVALLDRRGGLVGVYRKRHPVVEHLDPDPAVCESGVAPGVDLPAFDCDFGRVAFLICWDMAHDNAWRDAKAAGAELVAIPTASPQLVRPAAFADRYRYHVVTSSPRANATVFDPCGQVAAQTRDRPFLVHEVDLSWAIVPWGPTLAGGKLFTDRYGDRVGRRYSHEEDRGLFWSNDPATPVGDMLRALGQYDWDEVMARNTRVQDAERRRLRPAAP